MYYGYILRSEKTGAYYTGQTDDVEERVKKHNRGEERSTRSGRPWKLVFQKEFATRSEAMLWERSVKARKKRANIEKLIREYSTERGAAR
ncbi:MAG: GIY-YIG nuclease family protein [Bacteroidota bacterium]